MKHPVHDIHRGVIPLIPGGNGTGADWGWEQPNATSTALLHPTLSSCKLGERSCSQVQENAAVPGSGPAVSTATSIIQPGPGSCSISGGFLTKPVPSS